MTDDLNRLAADLTKAGLMAGVKATKVIDESSKRVQKMARDLAPRRFLPHYASTISQELEIERGAVVGVVGPERGGQGSLGHLLEFGTSRTPPHAHLGPSLDQEGPKFVKALGDIGIDL